MRAHVSSSSGDEDKKARGKKIYSSEGMFLGYENDFKKKEPSDEDKERIEAERRHNNAALAQGVCMSGREGEGGREGESERAREAERRHKNAALAQGKLLPVRACVLRAICQGGGAGGAALALGVRAPSDRDGCMVYVWCGWDGGAALATPVGAAAQAAAGISGMLVWPRRLPPAALPPCDVRPCLGTCCRACALASTLALLCLLSWLFLCPAHLLVQK